MDEVIIKTICNLRELNKHAVLVTVIDTQGSTPRKAGAKMLILDDGRVIGTVGGGCGEAAVKKRALMVLDEGKSATFSVEMLDDAAGQEGMVCGGIMQYLLQFV